MHPLLSSFCTELVKEASPRWMREAARDPSVLRGLGVRSGVEQMQPFLDNPQGVLAPGGREVRSGLKLDPTASHLSDVKHWPDAKSVLEGSTNTSDILHAHRNPLTAMESLVHPAWGEEALAATKEPLHTFRQTMQPPPQGPSRLPQRLNLYKGLSKLMPQDKVRKDALLQSEWKRVMGQGLPALGNVLKRV